MAASIVDPDTLIWGYGYAPAANPFQRGTMCVASSVKRTPTRQSGGKADPDDGSGSYAYDLNARIQSGFDAGLAKGADVDAPYWYPDPLGPFTTGLTNALSPTTQP